jgi:hypothetical protein
MPEFADQADYKYWAFISYSHSDRAWGDWLHRALETYRVPHHLVGQAARHGVVPKRAFPIFRDREELPGSADLGENLSRALQASRYLVVICSPRSAGSMWVGEEIKQFKALGREGRVLCLIVDGEPNASDKPGMESDECFPAAVRFRVDTHGALSSERTEPIAADARQGKDGKTNAKLKVLAGLLGVDYDALKQRDQARRMRRLQMVTAASVVLVATLTFLSVGFYQAKGQAEIARDAADRARTVAEAERQRALENLKESYNHRGLSAFYDQAPDRALFFLNEARRIDPTQTFTRYALADAWARVRDLTLALPGEQKPITRIEWSPDGGHLALQDSVGRVRQYRVATRERLLATAGRIQSISAPLVAQAGAVIAGFSAVPDPVDPNRLVRAIERHGADGRVLGEALRWPTEWPDVEDMALSPSGRYLLYNVATDPPVTRVHDFEHAELADIELSLSEPFGNSRWVFSDDESYLLQNHYSGSAPFYVTVRDAGGLELARLDVPARVEVIGLHGSLAVLGCADGSLWAYDLAHPQAPQWKHTGLHTGGISTLAFDRSGERLLSTDVLGQVAVWSARDGSTVWQRPSADHGLIYAGALSDDGQRIAVGFGTTVIIYDLATKNRVIHDWHKTPVKRLAFSADASLVAAATETGQVQVWRADAPVQAKSESYALPERAMFTRISKVDTGRYLVEGSAVYLLDARSRAITKIADTPQRMTLAPAERMFGIGYAWGQSLVVTLDAKGAPLSRNEFTHTGKALLEAPPAPGDVSMLVVMAGERIVGLGPDATTLPLEVALPGTTGDAWSVHFSADGARGFVAFANGRLLEIELSAEGVREVSWHQPLAGGATPTVLDISSSGDRLLLRRDQSVHVFEPDEQRTVTLSGSELLSAAFVGAHSARRIATVDTSGNFAAWSLEAQLLAQGAVIKPSPSGVQLGATRSRPGTGVVPVGDNTVATSVDARIYLWRLEDGRLLWRSTPLVEPGMQSVVNVLAAIEEGGALVATTTSAGLPQSFNRVIRVPVPGSDSSTSMPNVATVDAFVRDTLGYVYRGGALMSAPVALPK